MCFGSVRRPPSLPRSKAPDEDVESALKRMEAHQVRRIPVVDNSGMLVGIISQADIATRTRSEEKTAALVQEVSLPTGRLE